MEGENSGNTNHGAKLVVPYVVRPWCRAVPQENSWKVPKIGIEKYNFLCLMNNDQDNLI